VSDTEKDLSPIESIADGVKQKVVQLREGGESFWKTKEAILRGEKLYAWPNSDIKENGYLMPWRFNAIECGITGGLASITTTSLNFIASATQDQTDKKVLLIDDKFTGFFIKVVSWLSPFIAPLFLTCAVFIIAWGTLRRADKTLEKRKTARRAYLYFDGAYGLYPQLFLAFSIGFFFTRIGQQAFSSVDFAIPLLMLMAASFIRQFFLSIKTIPELLFVVNGYSTRFRVAGEKRKADDPPWGKYFLATILAGSPLIILVHAFFLAIVLLITSVFYLLSKVFS
jgi:hypothetical protein